MDKIQKDVRRVVFSDYTDYNQFSDYVKTTTIARYTAQGITDSSVQVCSITKPRLLTLNDKQWRVSPRATLNAEIASTS